MLHVQNVHLLARIVCFLQLGCKRLRTVHRSHNSGAIATLRPTAGIDWESNAEFKILARSRQRTFTAKDSVSESVSLGLAQNITAQLDLFTITARRPDKS